MTLHCDKQPIITPEGLHCKCRMCGKTRSYTYGLETSEDNVLLCDECTETMLKETTDGKSNRDTFEKRCKWVKDKLGVKATCVVCGKNSNPEYMHGITFVVLGFGVQKCACSPECYKVINAMIKKAPQINRERFQDTILKPCQVCGESKSKVCTRCKCARYCSAACQKVDWPEHKKNCKEFKKAENP